MSAKSLRHRSSVSSSIFFCQLSSVVLRSGQEFYRNPRPRKEDETQPLPNSNVICYFDDWEKLKIKSRKVSVIPRDVRSYLDSVHDLIFVE